MKVGRFLAEIRAGFEEPCCPAKGGLSLLGSLPYNVGTLNPLNILQKMSEEIFHRIQHSVAMRYAIYDLERTKST